MSLIIPVDPHEDESLAGFVVRATARNHFRIPLSALRDAGIKTVRLGSLCSRSSSLAASIAAWAGTQNVETLARMFLQPIDGRKGWIDFFGEPLRAIYRQPEKRRVAPATLKKQGYAKAVWTLHPLSFDPSTKERLIDSCPQCKRALGWTRTYGVAYCDYCSHPESFGQFTWYYPGLDLRDFPQPKVDVDDEEALNFLTGLIDPSPERKARAQKLVPDMWSSLTCGDLFEVGVTFASMLNVDHWDGRQSVRRRSKAGEGWDWLTPRMLSIGGRAIMDGQPGFEAFGDIVRREAADKPRARRYGKWAEIGPLSIVDPSLCGAAKKILGRATEAYVAARRDQDMQPLQTLAEKHGIERGRLKSLADSGLVPTSKTEGVRRGPVLMSAKALEPLLAKRKEAVSGTRAAPAIGVHPMHLAELERRGLLKPVVGAVLKLMKSVESYFTRASVEALTRSIAKNVKDDAPLDCVRLRVALRACNARTVPWPGIVQAILDGRLEVFDIKSDTSRRGLADRLAVRDKESLSSVIAQELATKSSELSEWIGNAAASEILGVNETVVWRLVKVGALERHGDAPLYSHFKRGEVERLRDRMIFTSEIRLTGAFKTYREASAWLRELGIPPCFELKRGGWKVYARAEVEAKLNLRIDALSPKPPPPPRPRGPRHGPDSAMGKLAAQQELADASRIGYATAAAILGSTIFAAQKLAANGHLKARRGSTPFDRIEVNALAKRIIFVPEIMRISGYDSYVGVTNWLKMVGIEALFWLKKGGIPVFPRAAVEAHVSRPEFVRGAHPRWIKHKLLDFVERGNSVYQAAIACGVSYPTAKRWAAKEKETNETTRGGRWTYPHSTKRKFLEMVRCGSSIQRAATKYGVNYTTARRWTNAEPLV
jgi:hypothetical protein